MPKTLLAVDDSATMRKVLEITFSGEDFKVTTADSSQAALAKTDAEAFVVDTSLGSEDGYALAKELRRRSPGSAIILLASRYAPYDQARGRDAGADDFADKPFDTQQLIDKVRKALLAREGGAGASVGGAPPAAAAAAPYRAPAPPVAQAPAAAMMGKNTQPSLGGAGRAATLMFGDQAPSPAPAPVAPAPAPVAARPAPAPAPMPAPAPVAAAPAPSPVAAAVNGRLQGKLNDLGLTPAQADAVMALSRDIVEKVVWEVVPQLAETLIKEEIARLTKEG